jgi:hypothetical protein
MNTRVAPRHQGFYFNSPRVSASSSATRTLFRSNFIATVPAFPIAGEADKPQSGAAGVRQSDPGDRLPPPPIDGLRRGEHRGTEWPSLLGRVFPRRLESRLEKRVLRPRPIAPMSRPPLDVGRLGSPRKVLWLRFDLNPSQELNLRFTPRPVACRRDGQAFEICGAAARREQTPRAFTLSRAAQMSIARRCRAVTTAWVLLIAPSFWMAWRVWVSTVSFDTPRISAVSTPVLPRAAQESTSFSRSVR